MELRILLAKLQHKKEILLWVSRKTDKVAYIINLPISNVFYTFS
jgi:hypothetical protein